MKHANFEERNSGSISSSDTEAINTQDHDNLLAETVNLIYYWKSFVYLRQLVDGTIAYVWISYAQSYYNFNDTAIIGSIIYLQYFCDALGAIIWSILGDKYGFDTIVLPVSIFVFLFDFTQIISFNFIVFSISSVLFFIFFGGYATLIRGSVAKLLPLNVAIKHNKDCVILSNMGWLSGPLLAGVISYFIGYTYVFIVSTFFAFVLILIAYFKIYNKQGLIINRQLNMRQLYNNCNNHLSDKNNQFPLCHETENVSNNYGLECPKFSGLLIIVLIQLGMIHTGNCVFSRWYAIYIIDKFGVNNTLISVSQFDLFICFVILGNLTFSRVISKYQTFEDLFYNILYTLIITSSILYLLVVLFMLFENNALEVWYLYIIMPLLGYLCGLVEVSIETLFLKIQSKKHSGKMTGIKRFLINTTRGFAVLVIGVLWDYSYNWLFYVSCIFVSSNMVFTVLFVVVENYKKNKEFGISPKVLFPAQINKGETEPLIHGKLNTDYSV